jgi:hypothetical protein
LKSTVQILNFLPSHHATWGLNMITILLT